MNNKIQIPLPACFSFKECLWFLNRDYDECLYRVYEDSVVKAISINKEPFLISVRENNNALEITILSGKASALQIEAIKKYVCNWFDLEKDLLPFYAQLKKVAGLAYMVESYHGLRLMGIEDLFEALCWSVIGQQINLTFAYKLKRRIVEKYGNSITYENEVYYLFPEPEAFASVTVADLRAMQFSDTKASYLLGVARLFAGGELSHQILQELSTLEDKQKALTAIRGIGIWSANYAMMKSLRIDSCIPHGDVGLLKALVDHQLIKERNENEKIEKLFKKFKGFESYLVFYLWRSLSGKEV